MDVTRYYKVVSKEVVQLALQLLEGRRKGMDAAKKFGRKYAQREAAGRSAYFFDLDICGVFSDRITKATVPLNHVCWTKPDKHGISRPKKVGLVNAQKEHKELWEAWADLKNKHDQSDSAFWNALGFDYFVGFPSTLGYQLCTERELMIISSKNIIVGFDTIEEISNLEAAEAFPNDK